jgi:uncharacterized protein DUF6580
MLKPRIALLISMIVAAAATRLMPHPPNLTSISAVALFGGAYFSDKRLAFLVPLAALLASDLVLGLYRGMEFQYLSFALIVVLGLWLQSRRRILPIAGAALASSTLFFIITNFGTWMTSDLYPHTAAGLTTCYTAAIPFFWNTVAGDVFYTALLFGGFAALERAFPILREAAAPRAAVAA